VEESVDAEYDAGARRCEGRRAKEAGIATGKAAAAAIPTRRSSDDLRAAITKPYAPGPRGVERAATVRPDGGRAAPLTAIRGGAVDGNPATDGEPARDSLCVTPPFPESPSTHTATGAAEATALALEVGDPHAFTVANPQGASRTYKRFSAAAHEEGSSRISCGIHFRSAMDAVRPPGERRCSSSRTSCRRDRAPGLPRPRGDQRAPAGPRV
jgi:hypothetical protein